jgi:hypothetical protein
VIPPKEGGQKTKDMVKGPVLRLVARSEISALNIKQNLFTKLYKGASVK